MRFTVERSRFLRALGHIQSVVERRNTIPILANVLLEAADGQLQLTATDMDLAIVETIEADVETQGAVTVMAFTLHDIVRKLPDGAQVSLARNEENNQLEVSSDKARFNLSTLPKEDFPNIAAEELPNSFALPAVQLKAIIDRTRFAISTEETRYYLNGIYVHVDKEADPASLVAVATDGHRLARYEIAAPEVNGELPGVIVPRKTVQELRKLIEDFDEEVAITLSENKIAFRFENIHLTSKLIDGSFPDYQRVIPQNNDRTLTVSAASFSEAVDRVATISTDRSKAIKLGINTDSMTISASNAEQGSGVDSVEVSYDGSEMEVGFNARYLLDITSQIASEEATLKLADPASPVLIRDGKDDAVIFVLMPMRV